MIVIVYMLLALVWWTVLLRKKNEEIYQFQKELFTAEMKNIYGTKEFNVNSNDAEFKAIEKHRDRQNLMVVSEGLVFGVSLMIGLWLVHRSYLREIKSTERQNNFLLSVTHELKSPLTSINLGFETLIKRSLPHAMVAEISESALGESKRLEKLINDILTATKVDGSYHYAFEEVDICEFVNIKVSSFQKIYPSNNLQFINELPQSTKAYIDVTAFEIVLSNLLENAVKYGLGAEVQVQIFFDNNQICIAVKDQGNTISESERNEIFKKFYRIGSEDVRKTKGTGLGLYISKKMIEAHDGKILVKPNIPKGNIFELRIPSRS